MHVYCRTVDHIHEVRHGKHTSCDSDGPTRGLRSANREAARPLRLFVYVVVHDTGFAPNPFFGYCTLTTCKPGIRGSARVGDWIAGIGPAQNGQQGKLVFAMRVAEAMCFDVYWNDARFVRKRPNRRGSPEQRCGDNIYHRNPGTSDWIQEDGYHSHSDGTPNWNNVRHDTSPPRVLVAREFAYFGAAAVDIPDRFRPWQGRDYFGSVRGYRCNFPIDLQNDFIGWLQDWSTEAAGLAGDPLDWPRTPPGCATTPPDEPATRRC